VSSLGPGPRIATALESRGNGESSVIVPVAEISIESAAGSPSASTNAARSDPGPESAVVVTSSEAAAAGVAPSPNASASAREA
jgi:hypothetical protein